MLRSFRVENHKSFRDEAELLLVPAYDKSRPVVPVAGIFGANASGKSNLLDALRWLQVAVRESYAQWEPGAGIPRTPFRLDPAVAAASSVYCVELVLDEGRFTYGLAADDERVVEEWLYTYPHNRRRVIFEREQGKVRLGSTVPDHRARGEQLARQTRDNALFLSSAAHNDLAQAQPVYNWFRSRLQFADGASVAGEELLHRLSDEQQREAVLELVGAADLGISDITGWDEERQAAVTRSVLREVFSSRQFMDALTDAAEESPLAKVVSQQMEGLESREAFLQLLSKQLEGRPDLRPGRLRFHHGASRTPLTLDEQSAGTRSWIGLISTAFDAITTRGVMIADEIDASLHPHLTTRLINLFRNSDTNPDGAQLFFATHDATLLDEDVLARDEIWFVEKEPDSGATRLYPLTDFHPRKNENTEGRYLAGGYGAVPILADYRFRRAVIAGRAQDAAA
ncbi:MAG: AAA family ATPase [Natronosporangium sp.]